MLATNNEFLKFYNIKINNVASDTSPIKVCNMKLLNFKEVLYLYDYINKKIQSIEALNPITRARLIVVQEVLEVVIAKWDDWN